MSRTDRAILTGNHLQWRDDAPRTDKPIDVDVTICNAFISDGQAMADALSRIAATTGLSALSDPLQWEREQRADRSLPGRDK